MANAFQPPPTWADPVIVKKIRDDDGKEIDKSGKIRLSRKEALGAELK